MPLIGTTIGKLLESTVEKHPEKEAVVFMENNIRLTFQQLLEEVHCVCLNSTFIVMPVYMIDETV